MQLQIPEAFQSYALRLLGVERYGRFAEALSDRPSVSVRLHPDKARRAGIVAERIPGSDGMVPWADGQAFYLKERPSFTSDPLLHSGAYYVQEASSMFLGQALRRYVTRPSLVLDLCAAPGGKSTLIRSLLPEGSLLVCNEPVKSRAQVLVENMTKWGHPDVVVTNSYPCDFSTLEGMFDVLVADVPCSGEGMFRKEEEAVAGWSMSQVMMCRERQREILREVWPALKPGGLLIYSTCTLNAYENEENVDWIACQLGAEVLPLPLDEQWGVTGNLLSGSAEVAGRWPVYRFIPGFTRGEGFFLAVLRKSGDGDGSSGQSFLNAKERKGKMKGRRDMPSSRQLSPLPAACKAWLRHPDVYQFRAEKEGYVAVRSEFCLCTELLQQQVKVLQAGIPLAVCKGRDWCPQHALALSADLCPSAFPVQPLSYEQAVSYLRKEALTLPAATPKGYVLLSYGGLPLGFAKNVGGRANNLYPQEWRIRSSYLSDYSLMSVNISD